MIDLNKIKEYIIGCDIDNTLTASPPFSIDTLGLEETRQLIRNAPVKKGVEILRQLDVKPVIITGRGDYYHEDSIYWFNNNLIPYIKLITISSDKYPGRRFNLQEYLNYKVCAYLENKIQFCLEDDKRVIEELEKYGIVCSLVEDDFEKAFLRLFE